MAAIGFRNTWNIKVYTKEGVLKYDSTFPNLVTNIGERWFLMGMYCEEDVQFNGFQQIGFFAEYVEPSRYFGEYISVWPIGFSIYGEDGSTDTISTYIVTEFTGSNEWNPSAPTTTPIITDTCSLTINEGYSIPIYNVYLQGQYYCTPLDRNRKVMFSLAALASPFIWENEETIDVTYTIEAYNA